MPNTRVEKWRSGDRKITEIHELALPRVISFFFFFFKHLVFTVEAVLCIAGTSQTLSASNKHTICVPLEKSIYESNYLRGLHLSRCFFLSLPSLSSLEMFVCF